MPKFHEGQQVQVRGRFIEPVLGWYKAKIIAQAQWHPDEKYNDYSVEFPDGALGVFDAEHIREDIDAI